MVYLKIGEQEFSGDLLPDMITPSMEIIKNEERSISGKMNVDITARKTKLQITWSIVPNEVMGAIIKVAENNDPDIVQYYDANGYVAVAMGQEPAVTIKTITAYAGAVSYTPLFLGDKMLWRDVSLELIEI